MSAAKTQEGAAQESSQKLEGLQILRALAAVLVVYTHTLNMATKHGSATLQASFHQLSNFGAVGVDVFFVISGFIMARTAMNSRRSAADFYVRRLVRIFPLYLLLTFVYVALLSLNGKQTDLVYLARSLVLLPSLLHPTALPILFTGWTLMFEMFFYTAMAAMLLFGKKNIARRTAALVGVVVVLGVLFHQRAPFNIYGNPIVLEFVAGMLLALTAPRIREVPFLPYLLTTLGALWLLTTVFTGAGSSWDLNELLLGGPVAWARLGAWGGGALLLVAGVVTLPLQVRGGAGRAGILLGDASYSVYLFHLIGLLLLARVWPILARLSADLGVLLATLLATLAGLGCYLVLERPLTLFLNSRLRAPRRFQPGGAGSAHSAEAGSLG